MAKFTKVLDNTSIKSRKKMNILLEKEPDLLTRKQYQKLLYISKSKMLEFINNGWIPAGKIARSYQIKKTVMYSHNPQ